MKKIAIACRVLSGHGGTTTTILEHTRRLTRRGIEVHLYGEKFDDARCRDAGGIPHRIFRLPLWSTAKRFAFATFFNWLTRNEKFDLVHGHGDILSQDILSLHNCVHAAHEFIHDRPAPKRGVARIHEKILTSQGFKMLIANSNLMKEDLMNRFHIPPEKIAVIYPGYDPEKFRLQDRGKIRPSMRQEWGVPSDALVVGLVTSGDYKKRGVDLFIETLALLSDDVKNKLQGWIIGHEREAVPYKKMAREAGLGSQIRFFAPAADIQNYYHAMDIFFYPARFEEFGQSVQEAMAVGLPVLTSHRVGAAELFSAVQSSFVIDTPEAPLFAQRLSDLIEHEDLRQKWADFGRQSCAFNTWDHNFLKTSELPPIPPSF